MKRSLLMCAVLLACATLAWAGGGATVMFAGGGVPVSAGGAPATGTVILGAENTGTSHESSSHSYSVFGMYNETALTASWTESDSTTTLASIRMQATTYAGGNVKACLYLSTGNQVACTNPVTISTGTLTMPFASPPTITKGTSYRIAFFVSADMAITFYRVATTGSNICFNDSASYTTPPSTLGSCDNDLGEDGVIEIWGVH